MYERYFGFKEKPFSVLPDPDFLYLSAQHSMAFSMLQYGVMSESGFIVVTGEIGCGKTILVRRLLNYHEKDAVIGLISNTSKFHGQILERVLMAFGLEFEGASHTAQYSRLVDFLVREYAKLRNVILIVDEAQNLSTDALEELRILSNINADKDQLIQLILLGQPELVDALRQSHMRQFAQRIAVHYHLKPLTESYTRKYVHHRLQVAGGNPTLFTDEACSVIYRMSRGIPRLINRYCDTALLYAYGDSKAQIDAALVTRVAQDINNGGLSGLSEVPPRVLGSLAPRQETMAAVQEVETSNQAARTPQEVTGNNADTSNPLKPIDATEQTGGGVTGDEQRAPPVAKPGSPSPGVQAPSQARFKPQTGEPRTDRGTPTATRDASGKVPAGSTSPSSRGVETSRVDTADTPPTKPDRAPQKETSAKSKARRRFWNLS